MIDRRLIADEFPVTSEWTFLSSAANGIVPERARRYLERYFAETHYLELADHYDMFEDLADVRRALARLYGGAERNWALMPNTCHALNLPAAAVDWRAGDNVVLADCEFPANVYPWLNLAARGVAINWARPRDMKATAELLMDACDDRTRVLTVSGVQFHNGYAPDLAALAAFCRERGFWFCVDAIQALGNRDWDLAELGADFVAAGAQKWLLGPRGAGALYVSDRVLDALDAGELRSAFQGWLNWETWRFDELLDFDRPLSTDARRLEVGTYPFHDLVAFGLSLQLIGEIGLPDIARHSDGLRDMLLAGLAERGLDGRFAYTGAEDPPARRSQIAALRCDDPNGVKSALAARKISASAREGALRVSFHLYNSEGDVERLLDALAEI